ncbi:MAG: hypothetical protein AB3X44_20480 [Leptothrix sp. (in: b-proteobacteria)]
MKARRGMTRQTPPQRLTRLGLLAALSALGSSAALAQSDATFGSDSQRYQPILAAPSAGLAPIAVLDGMYAANARVGQINVEVRGAGAPADGVTPVTVIVRVFDRTGAPLKEPVLITIEHSGSARLQMQGAATDEFGPSRKDADRRVPGTQLKVLDGEASFSLVAPSQPEDVLLRLTAGEAQVEGRIEFVPDLREMIAAGLIEGVLKLNRREDDSAVVPARLEDGFEAELTQWSRNFDQGRGQAAARAALFLKGKISGERLLTLSYDSDKESRARLLRDIKPEEFYPVYGDASLKSFEAQSSSKLYVRIDQQRSFVLWGDFNTADGFAQAAGSGRVAGTRLRQLGAYSRSITGARAHLERPDAFANLYASRDTLKQLTEELRANGTSGPFAVSNTQALEQSEKVELLVRDRNNLNTILSVTPLVRLNDYSFEPFSGRILLARPIPSLDSAGNPLSLRITYEVDQGGQAYWLAGADGQVNLGSRATLGGSLVEDQNPNAPFKLASVNTGLQIAEHTTLVAEVARTEANLTTLALQTPAVTPDPSAPTSSGRAGRLVLETQGESYKLRAYANRADARFANPAAGVQPGTQQGGVSLAVKASEPLTLKAEAQRTQDLATDARRTGLTLGGDYQWSEALTLGAGLRRIEEQGRLSGASSSLGANPDAGSAFGAGAGGGFSGAGSTTLINLNSLLTSTGSTPGSVPDLSATTAYVGAGLKVSERVALQGQLEHSVQGDAGRRAEVGASYQLAERSRLYARAESQTGLASRYGLDPASHSTVVAAGLDSSYMPGGNVFSEYRLRDAADARTAQLASGVRNTWAVQAGLLLSTGAERLKVLDGAGQNATALTFGADYTASEWWKGSGRLEWRRLDAPLSLSTALVEQDSYLSTLTVARKLDRDWTALARNYYLATDNHGALANGWQDRLQLGAAYRPVDHNRLDLLGKYEYKTEHNINATEEWRRVHVAALQANAHPSRPWWLSNRLAVKQVIERFPVTEGGVQDSYRAALLGARLIHDLTEQIDLGLQANVMRGAAAGQAGSATQKSLGLELGYLLQSNLWLSAGYNWAGFSDRDLSSDYTARGAYLRLRFKFDADLFSGDRPEINRSLPR